MARLNNNEARVNNVKYISRVNTNKKASMLALLTIILALLIIMIGAGYAKLIASKTGTVNAQVASMICNLNAEVDSSGSSINPICTVTVNNFNLVDGDYEVSQTSVDYRVEVVPKTEGFVLPTFYWKDTSGTVLQTNGARTGSFVAGARRTDEYILEFENNGEADVTAQVDINISAVQTQTEPTAEPEP